MINKLQCPSEDASVPRGREKKAITSGEGRRDLGRKVDWKRELEGARGEPHLVLEGQKGLKPWGPAERMKIPLYYTFPFEFEK